MARFRFNLPRTALQNICKKMNVEFIQRFCLSFTQATQNLQRGDDLCFKVGMNIFAVLNLNAVRPSAVELHS
jgi:hypothetical protein